MTTPSRIAPVFVRIGRWIEGYRTAQHLRRQSPEAREDLGLTLGDLARLA